MTYTGQFKCHIKVPSYRETLTKLDLLRVATSMFQPVWTTNGREVKQQDLNICCATWGAADFVKPVTPPTTGTQSNTVNLAGICYECPTSLFQDGGCQLARGVATWLLGGKREEFFVKPKRCEKLLNTPQSNIATENQHCSTLANSIMVFKGSPTAKLDSTE